MACNKKGPGGEEKAKNVEKLTDESLDKVSGGKVGCGPTATPCEPKRGVGCQPTWSPCEPRKAAPEIHWCGPTGGCKPKQD